MPEVMSVGPPIIRCISSTRAAHEAYSCDLGAPVFQNNTPYIGLGLTKLMASTIVVGVLLLAVALRLADSA